MRLSTVAVLVTLTFGLLAAPLSTAAQSARKVYRIGYLAPESPPTPEVPAIGLASFQQGLRELGYVEGDNLVVEYRWLRDSAGKPLPAEGLTRLVADLVSKKVDVIVTWTTVYTAAVQRQTSTIPIVCAVCADLVGGGVVTSLARPGGNVTGLTVVGPDLTAKRIEFLKALGAAHVIGLHSGPVTLSVIATQREAHQRAAQALDVRGETLQADSMDHVVSRMAGVARGRDVAVVFMESSVYLRERKRIAEWALRQKWPTAFAFREHVEAGGLLSYGTNLSALFRRAATYVDRILKGTKPADLPVEQPRELELVINLKTAKALGLTIPQSLLLRADRVIE